MLRFRNYVAQPMAEKRVVIHDQYCCFLFHITNQL
jgi:hypothetical protein